MLHQISPALSARNSGTEDVRDLLVACHQRIRHFTAIAGKLAHAQGESPDEVQRAADAVYRYYSVALPLHEFDEEESLQPRLSVIADDKLRHALLAMQDQHMAIDELLERLLPLVRMVTNNPDLIGDAAGEMCSLTKALGEIFGAHLQMEEETIFPAIDQLLSPQDRAEILSEMRGRRRSG